METGKAGFVHKWYKTIVNYRQLGYSNLKVSEVSLGSYLTYGDRVDDSLAELCIKTAFENGINFFDTAGSYAEGRGEEILAKSLKAYPREAYVISTKCFFPRDPSSELKGLSKQNINKSIEESLGAMRLDYVDILLAHRFDETTKLEETVEAFDNLIKAGKIRYWGVSRWNSEQMRLATEFCEKNNQAKPIENQYFYNMLNPIAEEIFPSCEELGIGVVAYSPLAQGVLSGKYFDDIPEGSRASDKQLKESMWHLKQEDMDKAMQLKLVADKQGVKLNHLALAWCLRQKVVSSVLIGASNPEQILDNLKVLDLSSGFN